MKYIANPVEVNAFKIVSIGAIDNNDCIPLALDNGSDVKSTPEMNVRMPNGSPKVGDYWVVQEDGYIYLNPAHIFERKYSPLIEDVPSPAPSPAPIIEG